MGERINYIEFTAQDTDSWLKMSKLLWNDVEEAEIREVLRKVNETDEHRIILAKNELTAIAFIYVSIRSGYVEGADTSPTGYLEGIYVAAGYRKMGVARKLVELGEAWLKANGCSQMGSDTWLWNTASQDFHKKVGFREEDTLVHFLKDIN